MTRPLRGLPGHAWQLCGLAHAAACNDVRSERGRCARPQGAPCAARHHAQMVTPATYLLRRLLHSQVSTRAVPATMEVFMAHDKLLKDLDHADYRDLKCSVLYAPCGRYSTVIHILYKRLTHLYGVKSCRVHVGD